MFALLSLREKVLGIVLILMVIAFGSFIVYHTITMGLIESDLEDANKTIGTQTTTIAQQRTSIDSLKASIVTQNEEVQRMLNAEVLASQQANAAIAKAKQDAQTIKMKLDKVLKLSTETGEVSQCTMIARVVDQTLKLRLDTGGLGQ